MSEAKRIAGKFRTSVLGIGPYCVEFPDGEIVSTRSEERQELIANAEQMKVDCDALLTALKKYWTMSNIGINTGITEDDAALAAILKSDPGFLKDWKEENGKVVAIEVVAQHTQKGNKR